MLFSHAANIQIWVEHQIRNNMRFISDIFWQAWPSDSEIAQSLFGTGTDGITAYTQNRSGYTVGDCNPDNMTVNHVLPDNFNDSTNPTIANNTIFVLDSGNYSYVWDPLQYLSGTCIALIASGNVSLNWSLIPINNPGKIIIDNISNPEISVSAKAYTNTGNNNKIVLTSNVAYTGYYSITWDGITNQVTGMIQTNTKTGSVTLTQWEGEKIIDVIFWTWDTIFMHFTKSIILDTTNPIFIWTTQTGSTVTSGGVYNTGVSFTFNDKYLSGATLDEVPYASGRVITGEWNHSFIVTDLAGNSTGFTFTIDTTLPIFTGTTLSWVHILSGGLYNTGVKFTFSDTNLSGATIEINYPSGITINYTSGTIFSTEGTHAFMVTDKAGNTTWTTFTIDTTSPICSPVSPLSGSTVTSGALWLSWNCSDDLAISGIVLIINDSGGNLVYTTNIGSTGTSFIYTGWSNTYNWKVVATDTAGNNWSTSFQKVNYIKPIIITLESSGNVYQNKYYVTGSNISINFSGNIPFTYQFTGEIAPSNTYAYLNWTTTRKLNLLSWSDGAKNVIMNYQNGSQSWSISRTFYLDSVAPILSVVYPTQNFKTSQTTINFQRSTVDTWWISGYNLLLDSKLIYTWSNNNFTVANITTGVQHNWSVQGIDYAGNTTTIFMHFTVDTSSPIISGVTSWAMYSSDVTPVFNIGTAILTGALNISWFTSGTPITGDGDYTLIVTNDVGNSATANFTIDKTAPNISAISPTNWANISGNRIGFLRNGVDNNMSGYLLNITSTGSYNTGISLTGSSIFLSNIPNGLYTWTVKAFDKAGNTNITSNMHFSIDTSSPTITGAKNWAIYSWDVTPVFSTGTAILTGALNISWFISGTPITGDGDYTLMVTNYVGNTSTVNFKIDKTAPSISIVSPTSWVVINTSNSTTFLRNWIDDNMSGYLLNITSTGSYNTGISLTGSSIFLSNIPNGLYTWTVKAFDKAGNTNITTGQSFSISVALSGSVSISWIIINNQWIYTNSLFEIDALVNKDVNISIVWDMLSGGLITTMTGWVSKSFMIQPTVVDWIKTFTVQATSGTETFSKIVTWYLDTTAPSVPTFSGQPTNYSGAFTLSWTASTDAGVGIWNYIYSILSGSTIVKSGVSSWASISISNMEIWGSGNYTLYVAAKDLLWNTSTSGNLTFGYVGIEDLTVDSFSITRITNASLNTKYKSDIITVSGITTGSRVLASVDNGSLIVNGTDVGVNQYVKLWDQVQIALYSSQDYNDMTAWKLTIWDQYSIFRVVTSLDGNGSSNGNNSYVNNYTISNLSTTEQLHIGMIYNALSNLYTSSEQTDFMLSLKTLVQNKISTMTSNNENITSIETMEYLFNLINNDFAGSSSSTSSSSSYIAPNGKSYSIQYTTNGYTSSTFIVTKYFTSLTDIKSYIDQKNPKSVYVGGNYSIDQSRTTSTYIAPNGKSYVFFKTTDGKYGSNNFQTAKLFTSLAKMKHHIDVNNPAY